jgi:hypothetical protein
MENIMNIPTDFVWNMYIVFILKITIMAVGWNFEVVPNKFNVERVCGSGYYAQKQITKFYLY